MRANWFVALPCPGGEWFSRGIAAHPAPPRVRVFCPDDLHLTVAFLGAVNEEAALSAFQQHSLWNCGSVQATFGAVVPMGPPRRFSALSLLLAQGRAEVEQGIRRCRDPMRAAAGLDPERRDAVAHLTIARPQRRATEQERRAALDWAGRLRFGPVTVELNEMALYTWSDDRRDSLFRVVERTHIG